MAKFLASSVALLVLAASLSGCYFRGYHDRDRGPYVGGGYGQQGGPGPGPGYHNY